MTPRTVGKRRHFHPADCGPLYVVGAWFVCVAIVVLTYWTVSGVLYATGVWR